MKSKMSDMLKVGLSALTVLTMTGNAAYGMLEGNSNDEELRMKNLPLQQPGSQFVPNANYSGENQQDQNVSSFNISEQEVEESHEVDVEQLLYSLDQHKAENYKLQQQLEEMKSKAEQYEAESKQDKQQIEDLIQKLKHTREAKDAAIEDAHKHIKQLQLKGQETEKKIQQLKKQSTDYSNDVQVLSVQLENEKLNRERQAQYFSKKLETLKTKHKQSKQQAIETLKTKHKQSKQQAIEETVHQVQIETQDTINDLKYKVDRLTRQLKEKEEIANERQKKIAQKKIKWKDKEANYQDKINSLEKQKNDLQQQLFSVALTQNGMVNPTLDGNLTRTLHIANAQNIQLHAEDGETKAENRQQSLSTVNDCDDNSSEKSYVSSQNSEAIVTPKRTPVQNTKNERSVVNSNKSPRSSDVPVAQPAKKKTIPQQVTKEMISTQAKISRLNSVLKALEQGEMKFEGGQTKTQSEILKVTKQLKQAEERLVELQKKSGQ